MESFDTYAKRMMEDYKTNSWEIGWESLPKYIGHKIFNKETREVGTVKWDKYPKIVKEDGTQCSCSCSDFRHDKALWIYKVGEDYGCEYCQNHKSLYYNKKSEDVREVYIEGDATMTIASNTCNKNDYEESCAIGFTARESYLMSQHSYNIDINYCPRCGRKLR